jgi:DNA invertase Pin-like site-specific DNA recombinase
MRPDSDRYDGCTLFRRVTCVSLKEDVDTSTRADEPIFHVMVAIGQLERNLIGDHIWSGPDREVRG